MFRGAMKGFHNPGVGIVADYNSRLRLAELGYKTDINDLDCFTAECFLIVSGEITKIQKEKAKNKGR